MSEMLALLQEPERELYTQCLCRVVGITFGGHGQAYGALSRLVFATPTEQAQAWNRMTSELLSRDVDEIAGRYQEDEG
ncbi:MAG: hypothetical protein ACFFD1_01055 [Candidatus Thorarchaeota archaeon]